MAASDKYADLLREAREVFEKDLDFDRTNMEEAELDAKFNAGEQWPEEAVSARGDRPMLTINRVPQFLRQVIGDMRKNPPAVKVRPADQGTDKQSAAMMNGLIRNIEAQSRATYVYIKAAENQVQGGMGHFRVATEYADDDGWDLDIRIRPIPSPFAVVWDANSMLPTREDAQHCFVMERLTTAEFERRYPENVPESWDSFRTEYSHWCQGDFVIIAEYWWKEPVSKTLLRMTDGKIIDAADLPKEAIEEARAAGAIERERKVQSHVVKQCILTACDVLEPPSEFPSRYIPIVPVIGEEINIGERVVRRGLVRSLRDPQRMYNYHRSAYVEAIALAPKPKWLATPDQLRGHESRWSNANLSPDPVLLYNVDRNAPGLPQRVSPEMPAAAILQEIQISASDMEGVSGIYRAALGAPSNEISGKAIQARNSESDTGAFLYRDNLELAVAHCGTILVDMLPRVYDTQRVVRVLGEDGTEEFVQINVALPDGSKVNDLAAGKYDVVASTGPSYGTKMEEQRDTLNLLVSSYPQLMQMAGDLVVKAQQLPDGDKLAARLRKPIVAQGLAEPEEGDQPPQPPPPSPEMIAAQAQMKLADAEMAKQQVAGQKVQVEMFEAQNNAAIKRAELMLEAKRVQLDEGHLQLDAIQTQAKVRNDDTSTRVNAASKAADTAIKLFRPPAAPQTQQAPPPR